MSRGFVAVPEDVTVAEAIERLPADERAAHLAMVYVVDDDHRLLNVVAVPQLLGMERHLPIKLVPMKHVVSVTVDADQETVAQIARRNHLLVVPVIDQSGRLVGSIDAHDVLEIFLTKRQFQRSRLRRSSTAKLARLIDALRKSLRRWIPVLRLRFWRP